MLSDDVAIHEGRPVVYEFERNPPVLDASAVSAVPPLPKRSDPSVTDESPVPPPVTLSVPIVEGVIVKVPALLVMVFPRVRPLKDCVDVANVMAPVCAEPNDCCIEVTPAAAAEIQTPERSLKQPPVNWIPLAKVLVAEVPVTLRYDVCIPLVKVEVADAVTLRLPVTARFVEVAFVVVLTFIVKPLIVEDAAWTVIPMVEVGASDPPVIAQSRNELVR
jgi:hypothetical protein